MNHLSEEQLILHYYGEDPHDDNSADANSGQPVTLDALTIERHLEECGECRTLFASVQRVLNIVDSFPVPEQPANYGEQVWKRIEPKLPARRMGWFALPAPWRWAAVGAAAAVLLVSA